MKVKPTLEFSKMDHQARQSSIWPAVLNTDPEGLPQTPPSSSHIHLETRPRRWPSDGVLTLVPLQKLPP